MGHKNNVQTLHINIVNGLIKPSEYARNRCVMYDKNWSLRSLANAERSMLLVYLLPSKEN